MNIFNKIKNYFQDLVSDNDGLSKNSNQLSNIEIQIIEQICKEYSNQKIATNLSINIKALQAHFDKIIQKTDSKNIVGVVIYAIEHNLHQVNIVSDKIKVLNVEF